MPKRLTASEVAERLRRGDHEKVRAAVTDVGGVLRAEEDSRRLFDQALV